MESERHTDTRKKHRPRRRGGRRRRRAERSSIRCASAPPGPHGRLYETLPPARRRPPLVVVAEAGAHGGGRRGFAEVLLERLQTLTKDNDATPCKVDRRQNRRGLDAALKKCLASKTRYAAVAVVAKLPQPPLHVRGAPVLIACVWAASFETFTSRTDGVCARGIDDMSCSCTTLRAIAAAAIDAHAVASMAFDWPPSMRERDRRSQTNNAGAHDPAVAAARDGAAAHLVACIHDGKPGHECAQVANRLVAWFIDSDSCASATTKVRCAYKLADANFQVVLAESRPRTSLRVLERVLPSHFLNVAKSVPVDDADQNIERRAASQGARGRRAALRGGEGRRVCFSLRVGGAPRRSACLLAAKLDDDLRACDALVFVSFCL